MESLWIKTTKNNEIFEQLIAWYLRLKLKKKCFHKRVSVHKYAS